MTATTNLYTVAQPGRCADVRTGSRKGSGVVKQPTAGCLGHEGETPQMTFRSNELGHANISMKLLNEAMYGKFQVIATCKKEALSLGIYSALRRRYACGLYRADLKRINANVLRQRKKTERLKTQSIVKPQWKNYAQGRTSMVC